jgi:hypothetical protein
VNREHTGVGPDEAIEVLNVAGDDVGFGVRVEKQALDHPKSVRHVLGAAVGP